MKFYFNANNMTQANALRKIGARHIFINHKYVKKNLKKMIDGFDSVLLSPDHNEEVKDYYKFVEDDLPEDQLALQYDYPKDPVINMRYFKEGKDYGDNIIPVLHGGYFNVLPLFKPHIKDGALIALGKMRGQIEEDEMVRRLPPIYRYHGLGKGRWVNSKYINSVDSSTWLSGVIGRKTDVYQGQQIMFGKKGTTNKSSVQAALKRNQNFLKEIELSEEQVLNGEYEALMLVPHIVYYKPLFKSLGILEDNYKLQ